MVTKYPFYNTDFENARARITNINHNGAIRIAYIWIDRNDDTERTMHYTSNEHFLTCWKPAGIFLNRKRWHNVAG